MRKVTSFTLAALLLAPLGDLHAAGLTNLRCEYRTAPLGIDVMQPRLCRVLEERSQKLGARGQKQTAYQVLVGSTPERLAKDKGDLWDSGKVFSEQSLALRYSGSPLVSETRYWWKVRVWDKAGKPIPWSEPATFLTGKLKSGDWRGKWIGPVLAWPAATPVALGFAVESKRADEEHWVQVDFGQELDCVVS